MAGERQWMVVGGSSSNQQQSRRRRFVMDEEYDRSQENEEVGIMDVDDEDEDMPSVQNGFEDDDDDESDGIPSSLEEFPEQTLVDCQSVRQHFMCGICLGILQNTRTFMDCLHRFCGGCINKAIRQGKNECPICRTHCPSRRSLRADESIDNFILTALNEIDARDEEEEFPLKEDDNAHNTQAQANIEQTGQRQTEKQKNKIRDLANTSTQRLAQRPQKAHARKRRNRRLASRNNETEKEPIDQAQDEHDQNSEDGEALIEIMQRRSKRRTKTYVASSSTIDSDEVVLKSKNPSWDGGVVWSHSQYGSSDASRGINTTRSTKLSEYLHSQKDDVNEFKVHVKLVPFDDELRVDGLEMPNIYCSSILSVNHLREYVARDTPLRVRDVELLMDLLPLEGSKTLADLHAHCPPKTKLIIAYRQKNAY